MANKSSLIFAGVVIIAACVGGVFLLGTPMFGYKYVGLDNGGAVALSSIDEEQIRSDYEAARRERLEAYIDGHYVLYNRYGCAYYAYRTNGDIKAPVFTKDGPLCDGPVREPRNVER